MGCGELNLIKMSQKVLYTVPQVLWIEEIVLEKAFLQGSQVSGSVSSGGMGHTSVGGYENDDWGGND